MLVYLCRRDIVGAEESKIQSANDRALQEMKIRMDRELEAAKLELLEVTAGFNLRLKV